MKMRFSFLRRFGHDDEGSIAVETVLIVPMLFWVYLTMFSIFDSYRQYSINSKAAFTIGDIISRETTPLDSSYLTGMREMLAYLTANSKDGVAIRITSVNYDDDGDVYQRDWSRESGWKLVLTDTDVNDLRNNLPTMPANEHVTVVETFVKYEAPFNIGLPNRKIHNFVFTRPRYAPRVCWVDCN